MVTTFRRRFLGKILIAGLLSGALLATAGAYAYQVQPMSYFLMPSGQQASRRMIVTNTDAVPLDIEMQVFSVDVDLDGKRTFTPADDQFLVFPAQATVRPGAAQSFQVRYIGDPKPPQGRIYVVKVRQLNVNYITRELAPGKTSQVAIAMNFNTTAVVQPEKARAAVAIVKNLAKTSDGKYGALIANSGDGVADLSEMPWTIVRGGKTEALPVEKLKYGETSMLAPGASRHITVDGPLAVDGASLALASR